VAIAVGVGVNIVDKTLPPGFFAVGNRPTAISPRRPKDCDSSLLFRSPKALKVPSRHHVEVRVKPARYDCKGLLNSRRSTYQEGKGHDLFDCKLNLVTSVISHVAPVLSAKMALAKGARPENL